MRNRTNRKSVFDATIMAGFNTDVNRVLTESTGGVRELICFAQGHQIGNIVAGFTAGVNRALAESTGGIRELNCIAQISQFDSIAPIGALAREISPALISQRSLAAREEPITEEPEDNPERHQHCNGEEYLPWAIS